MSQVATGWAMVLDLPPVAKLILWVLADHAGEDGLATWATPEMMSTVVSQTTPATMRTHIGKLLAEGCIREGDQNRISPSWLKQPAKFRPIVWDLAMNEETRLAWQAAYDPTAGRRGAAVAAGRLAGQASAAARKHTQSGETPSPAGPAAEGSGKQQAARCQENQHQPGCRCQIFQHQPLAKPDTGPVSENPPAGVEKFDPLIRTKDSSTTTEDKDGEGGNPPSPQVVIAAGSTSPDNPVKPPDDSDLAGEVLAARPGWTRAAVATALSDAAAAGAGPAEIREVILTLAADPETSHPGRLRHVLAAARRRAAPTGQAPSPAGRLPPDWEPSREHLAWAALTYPSVDAATATCGFRTYYESSGTARPDWPAKWRQWIAREAKFQADRGTGDWPGETSYPGPPPAPVRPAAATAAARPAPGGEDQPGPDPAAPAMTREEHIAKVKGDFARRLGYQFSPEFRGVALTPPAPCSPDPAAAPARPPDEGDPHP